jgi:glyoxylase-like metal-dependent hydrolase (beta-lactamase superfamily II)
MESSLIKNGNPEVVKKYMPDGKITCSVNTYVVKGKNQTVLIDAGLSGNIDLKLVEAGISPNSVKLILITHGHNDHVSGLVKNDKAAFPNAKVLFSEKEKPLYADSAIEKLPAQYKPFFVGTNQVLKIYGNKVGTFTFGKTVADGIVPVDMNGHTPGHSGFLIESKGQKLLIAGDFLHIGAVQFPHPEYSLVFDADTKQAAEMRKLILDRLVKEKLTIAATHLSFPGIGTVSSAKESLVFTSVK